MPFAWTPHRSRAERRPRRIAAIAACAYDLATLTALVAAGALLSALWLLARTDGGRLDVPPGDATALAALAAALLPAWAAAQGRSLWHSGRTAGGARLTLTATTLPTPRRRALWLALHPAVLPAWWWLVHGTLIAGLSWLGWPLVAIATLIQLLAAGSALAALVRPRTTPWHARLAAWRA